MDRLPQADWTGREGLARLVEALGAGNLRWVGGAVRDTLLGKPVKDIDAATPLEPTEVIGHGPIAYEAGTYSVELAEGRHDRGKYVLVLRNLHGTWRTEKTIWSSDLPPVPASAD